MTITINDLAVTLATERLALAVSLRSGVWTATVTFGGHPLDGCFTASAEAESLDEAVAGAIEEWRAFREEAEAREDDGVDPDLAWNERHERAEARLAGWDDDGGFECPEDHDERDHDLEIVEEDACF